MVPPITILAKLMTDYLLARNWSLTSVRKFIQSICFLGQNCALFVMCHTNDFNVALVSMSIIIGATGFHNTGKIINEFFLSSLPLNIYTFSRCNCESTRSRAHLFRKCFWTNEHRRCYPWILGSVLGRSHSGIDSKVIFYAFFILNFKFSRLNIWSCLKRTN